MSALSSSPTNYSIYAIPAFYVLVLLPQALGTFAILRANNYNFDNANPRGQNFQSSLRKSLPKSTLAFYERANAAHNNGWENFILFTAAVICGNLARLDVGTLNGAAGAFLALRTLYVGVYLGVERRKLAWSRTGIWAAGAGCCLYLLAEAGRVVASGGPLAV
ncbi:uncharacterized protein KY384_003792 [Bacidia gigantensis]|uniref:uncharacterized protein n=1 Tax=Bacidia gigantensis TaxID=2732470 RepID=UPI001D047059|nr:uncharacterized protein KY384_003792 [Bacidia gigantensis]KAG8532152.1 hypothetical protein KY384_003792 [Bacidia gigantensis]